MINKEELLLKLFEVLKEKGFEHFTLDKTTWWMDKENREYALDKNVYFSLIFSVEFAKFIWGEENIEINGKTGFSWRLHLGELAKSDDRLGYISKTYLSNF